MGTQLTWGGVFFLFSFVCSKSGHVLEVDYKHVCIRSARRLLPSQQQDQQGGGAGRALAGRRGVRGSSAVIRAEGNSNKPLVN